MQQLLTWSVAIFPIINFVGDWWKGFSITGSANPPTAQLGQKVILSCEMGGCTSSNLQMHLYKWESCKNQTLFIHNSTKQHNIQENHPEEREENGSPRGQYKSGLLSVTLDQVQLANSGQYVCAGMCDDVFKESKMELKVEEKIKAGIGKVAVFTFQPFETCNVSHLKLLWRRTDSGKRQKIYSYLHQEACPIIYSEDTLGDRCSSSLGPISKERFGKKYQQRVEISKSQMLMRNVTSFKVSNIQREDAGKYMFSVESRELRKVVVFSLSVTEQLHSEKDNRPSDIISLVLSILIILELVFIFARYKSNPKDPLRKENAHKIEQSKCLSLETADPLKAENDQLRTENERLKFEKAQAEAAKEFSDARFYKVDLTFDSKTAHPRLEVSEAGKSVRDTGNIFQVSNNEKRFDSHAFILAIQGYSKGKYYWEVDVSQKKKWDLGVASESICRKGTITFSPQNGYWVIGLDGGKDYWARTDPWTLLKVTGKPTRIGVFLDMSADKSLSFYDVNTKKKLHTFSIHCSEKMYPFFSVGSGTVQRDNLTLKIVNVEEERGLHEN